MFDVLQDKRRGDRYTAREINLLSDILSANSVSAASYHNIIDAGAFIGESYRHGFIEDVFEIVSQENATIALFFVKPRWYNHNTNTWHTDTNSNPYLLDATMFQSMHDVTFEVGDILVAYWDDQRSAFIPITTPGRQLAFSLVDVRAIEQPIAKMQEGPPNIHFCLEQYDRQLNDWRAVNDRIYTVNANFAAYGGAYGLPEISSTGHYTMMIDGDVYRDTYLRVTAGSELVTDFELIFCALRIETKDRGGIEHTLGGRLYGGGPIHHENFEAEINNDPPDPDEEFDKPYVTVDFVDNDTIVVLHVPPGQKWTFENNLNCRFGPAGYVPPGEQYSEIYPIDTWRSWLRVDADEDGPVDDFCQDSHEIFAAQPDTFWFGHGGAGVGYGFGTGIPKWFSVELKFQLLDVPQGATITSAIIEITADEDSRDPHIQNRIWIRAYDYDDGDRLPVPNMAGLGDSSCPEDGWDKTLANVTWFPPQVLNNEVYETPDLRAIVQEIVNRPGWQPEQKIIFLFEGTYLGDDELLDALHRADFAELHVAWIEQ